MNGSSKVGGRGRSSLPRRGGWLLGQVQVCAGSRTQIEAMARALAGSPGNSRPRRVTGGAIGVPMAKGAVLAAVAVGVAAVIGGAARAVGAHSVLVAFLVVWFPMAWFALLWRFCDLRLPDEVHRLFPFERSGRIYVWLGVPVAKRLLRRGPLTVFNLPRMRLPAARTPEALAALDRRMKTAEATHGVMFAATLPIAAGGALAGWYDWAAWVLVFDLLVNGYPAMLQRYNRALLGR